MVGLIPINDSELVDIMLITNGRANAIPTQAAALSPGVFAKTSIPSPKRNAEVSNIHRDVEKGSSKIK